MDIGETYSASLYGRVVAVRNVTLTNGCTTATANDAGNTIASNDAGATIIGRTGNETLLVRSPER